MLPNYLCNHEMFADQTGNRSFKMTKMPKTTRPARSPTVTAEASSRPTPSAARLRTIVKIAIPALFEQIRGGRIVCESEATLQLHLGRIIATVADLHLLTPRETFSIELEKPLRGGRGKRGRIDIWFQLASDTGPTVRCAIELKFFKAVNHREPNNRYDVFKDIARLESCRDVADVAFMLVGTDHQHYISQVNYSPDTKDFDTRHGAINWAGRQLEYRTSTPHGPPITLAHNYQFEWEALPDTHYYGRTLHFLLVEVTPDQDFAADSIIRDDRGSASVAIEV